METFIKDIQYAIRGLLRRPAFTSLAVLTLALGIGANTAIFGMLDAVMFRTLPVAAPEQLIKLETVREAGRRNLNYSYPVYRDYRDNNQVCSSLAASYSTPLNLSGGGATAERVFGTIASGEYFTTLGVTPVLGRVFTTADDQTPGGHPVVVLSYGLWQRRFGGANDVVGKTLEINKQMFTVVGVMPASFTGTVRGFSSELWMPLMMHAQAVPADPPDALKRRGFSFLEVIGRLKPGVSHAQAAASFEALGRQIDEANGIKSVERLTAVSHERGESYLVQDFGKPLIVMMVAVGLVLLIACANVANLLLVRASTRRKEIAVRLAVGATRARLIRQLLTESLVLSVTGGAVGLLIAFWADPFWKLIKPADDFLPLTLQSGLSLRVLGFALLVSLITGIAFGLIPALQASRVDYTPALKDEAPHWRGERRFQLRDLLVVAQVAISLVVLVGAGLFVRSLRELQKIDVGFQPERTLVVTVDPSLQGYDREKGSELYRQLLERVRSVPGVKNATYAATVTPNAGGSLIEDAVQIEGRSLGDMVAVEYNRVGPDYFTTMNIVLRGRDFTTADRRGAQPVAIINESMARKVFPKEDPIGKRFRFGQEGPFSEVIGVARDGKYRSLREEPQLCVYEPFFMGYRAEMNLLVRSDLDQQALLGQIRNQLGAIDPTIPVFNVRTLDDQVRSVASQERATALTTTLFGALALLLATIGLYGVMSYAVVQRTREIGIRMALGARTADVLSMVLMSGMKLALIGVAVGVVTALALTRVIRSFLFGITATDVFTFTTVAAGLIFVALLACLIPARRAAKVDPLVALKSE
jgi:predicted permease